MSEGYVRHRVRAQVDTLRGLATYYLGDHTRWVDIAVLNGLRPVEYQDLSGLTELLIPIELGPAGEQADPYLVDLAVKDGALVLDERGELGTIGGPRNLLVSLLRALTTEEGQLLAHQGYGYGLRKFIGKAGTALYLRYHKLETERVIRRDPRVADVTNIRVRQKPGTRRVEIAATVHPIGTADTIELVFERSA